ncbi:MAG: hypothetical protein ACOZBW_14065 [Thermodesulfobacteriota bacterium]
MNVFTGMDDIWPGDVRRDGVDCLGRFNAQSRLCTRRCALVLRCITEYNRRLNMMDADDLFDLQDIDAADIQ